MLQSRGYQKLVLQVGRGELKPALRGSPALAVEAFRFKDSLAEDLRRADLVISHAGRGPRLCAEPVLLGAGVGVGWMKSCFSAARRWAGSECAGPELELDG